MENTSPAHSITPVNPEMIPMKQFTFHGSGSSLFGIYLVNILLSIVTLGFYYPWAKAAVLKYNYGETEFAGSRFTFHGTGKEMFIGMIKAIIVLGGILCLFYFCLFALDAPVIGFIMYMTALIFITPLAIVGSLRYRTSRSSWRGIHFGYRGNYKSMMLIFVKGILLTAVTLGIYGAWFSMNIINEIYSNLRMGNLKFEYKGKGGEYFGLTLKGYFFTILTLGIYFFKWQSNLYNYVMNNIYIHQDEKRGKFESTTTGMGFFKLMFVNALIILFSAGIATPWAIARTMRFYMENSFIDGNIDFNSITQTEEYKTGATGEGLFDAMDLNIT